MARDPASRPTARELGDRLEAWLDGSARIARAHDRIAAAAALEPRAAALLSEASTLRDAASDALDALPRDATLDAKLPHWRTCDRADDLLVEATVVEAERFRLLEIALGEAPALDEVHQALADLYRERHARAERQGNRAGAAMSERMLRTHDRGGWATYLEGTGAVTLATEPPGATVTAWVVAEVDRRLQRVGDGRVLGRTPLVDVPLAHGLHDLELSLPGRPTVRLPIQVERCGRWRNVPPGGGGPCAISIPEELGADEVYVPAGWALLSPNPGRPAVPVWVDGFVIRRFHVTNREYLRFLDAVAAREGLPAALARAPRERRGGPLARPGPNGRMALIPDQDGDQWDLDWPVLLVSGADAEAYARWTAERTGLPWRLPLEVEWEKAARGTDGRPYATGNHADGAFAWIVDSHGDRRQLPAPVGHRPLDVSPYGVRDTMGGARDFCADPFTDPRGRVVRGGSWLAQPSHAAATARAYVREGTCIETTGFRLALPIRG